MTTGNKSDKPAGEPLISNGELKRLLSRAKGMSSTNQDTIWEGFVYVRGTYERALAELLATINRLERERWEQWQDVEAGDKTSGTGFGDIEFRLTNHHKTGKANVVHIYKTTVNGWAHVGLVVLPDDWRIQRRREETEANDVRQS